MQPLHRRDGSDHTERAVVLAGVAHGVEVRAEQQRAFAQTLVAPAQVADVVTGDRHAGLAHPVPHQLVRSAHRIGGERPGDYARLVCAFGQVMAALDDDPRQRGHAISVKVISCAPFHSTRSPSSFKRSVPS